MRKGWETKRIEECIAPVEYTRKIQRKDFLEEGQFPIVSQEAEFTNGCWNDSSDVFRVTIPVVIFGAFDLVRYTTVHTIIYIFFQLKT